MRPRQDSVLVAFVVISKLRGVAAIILALAIAISLAPTIPATAQDNLSDLISSRRYIVIDADTGEVFAQKDADDEVAIASLTKIFTTIEALELAPLDTVITTDESDLFDSSSTTMGFGPGETFTLEQLLYGMMLPSGNDAAHAVARSLGAQEGDSAEEAVNRFVALMNQRLANMGLTETTLINPHGLGVPGHHSSAHDLATFAMYAVNYQTFLDLISTKTYDANGYELSNTNKLLNQFDGLIGGKTGYDEDSGYCLVEVARREGSTMISVTLDGAAPDIWYEDNAILLDYAFEQKAQRIANGDPIAGQVLSYRDPDAAIVAQIATAEASLGFVETPVPAPTRSAGSTPTPVAEKSVFTGDAGGSRRNNSLLAVLVVLLIVAASVGAAYRRNPAVEVPDDPEQPAPVASPDQSRE